MMDIQAQVAFGGKVRFAGMQTDPDTHVHVVGPGMSEKASLYPYGSRDGIGGASEDREEGVALGVDDLPTSAVERLLQQVPAVRQHPGVAITELLEQTGGSLHVREEQRDGS